MQIVVISVLVYEAPRLLAAWVAALIENLSADGTDGNPVLLDRPVVETVD